LAAVHISDTPSTVTPASAIDHGRRSDRPRATAREVISTILYLRQHYHFGPARIAA
jgi:hypothetical protein